MQSFFGSVKTMIERYLSLYSPHPPRWDNITSLASTLQWNDLITQSTADWLQSQGVSKQFIYELVEVAVRVNYGQVSQTGIYSNPLPRLNFPLGCRAHSCSGRLSLVGCQQCGLHQRRQLSSLRELPSKVWSQCSSEHKCQFPRI